MVSNWQFELMTIHSFSQANIWLGTLLLERSEDIYRMKGLLSVQGMDERFVFQVSVKEFGSATYACLVVWLFLDLVLNSHCCVRCIFCSLILKIAIYVL